MRTIALAFVTLLAFAAAGPLRAEDAKPFATGKTIDLTTLLRPPPANESVQTKAELGEVLTLQVTRSPEMEASAKADAVEDVWRFADVMGPAFKTEALPVFSAFFDRVVATDRRTPARMR